MSGCTGLNGNPAGQYDSYNCNQLSMERYAITDEIQQATGEQSTNQIYQLAIAAFALSKGDNYNAKADSNKTDQLNAQLNEVRREAIRKDCNW